MRALDFAQIKSVSGGATGVEIINLIKLLKGFGMKLIASLGLSLRVKLLE